MSAKILNESENDHEDQRVRYEPSIEDEKLFASTVISFTDKEAEAAYSPSQIDFDDEKFHEKVLDELPYEDSQEYDLTSQTPTIVSSSLPSLTKIPSIHPTHVTTHITINPTNFSETVITHLEKHRLKGSQK